MLHHLLHPTGWWILADLILFGATATTLLLLADDTDWL